MFHCSLLYALVGCELGGDAEVFEVAMEEGEEELWEDVSTVELEVLLGSETLLRLEVDHAPNHTLWGGGGGGNPRGYRKGNMYMYNVCTQVHVHVVSKLRKLHTKHMVKVHVWIKITQVHVHCTCWVKLYTKRMVKGR